MDYLAANANVDLQSQTSFEAYMRMYEEVANDAMRM